MKLIIVICLISISLFSYEIQRTFWNGSTKNYIIKCTSGETTNVMYYNNNTGYWGENSNSYDSLDKAVSDNCSKNSSYQYISTPISLNNYEELNRTLTTKKKDKIFNNGTVLDTGTNLMWMRCAVGQKYETNQCIGEPEKFLWNRTSRASQIINNKNFAGYTNWRVPSIYELITINYCSSEKIELLSDGVYCKGKFKRPTINSKIFPNNGDDFYYSSTRNNTYTEGGAYGMNFSWANPGSAGMEADYPVRLVRDMN